MPFLSNGSNRLSLRKEIEVARSADREGRKLLIVVMPTHTANSHRAFQGYYLSRLGQTLRLVMPPLLWIVVEMSVASVETADTLMGAGGIYRHLVCKNNLTNIKDRGIHQRNTALRNIQRQRHDGIVYFADDDNIYSPELFERLREISASDLQEKVQITS